MCVKFTRDGILVKQKQVQNTANMNLIEGCCLQPTLDWGRLGGKHVKLEFNYILLGAKRFKGGSNWVSLGAKSFKLGLNSVLL